MSRSGSIAALLGDPELRVQAVAPSGDCFYEAIGIALASVGEGVGEQEGETATAALRRLVAEEVDQEVFDNFMAFHLAGLHDFSFMKRMRCVEDLKDRLQVSGKAGAGAGHCMWANEWEIGVVCRKLALTCLVVDQQAKDPDHRFVKVGEPAEGRQWRYVMLQRSRREHYNLLVSQLGTSKLGVFKLDEVSEKIRRLWRI